MVLVREPLRLRAIALGSATAGETLCRWSLRPVVTSLSCSDACVNNYDISVTPVLWQCWLGVRKSTRTAKIEWWSAGVVTSLSAIGMSSSWSTVSKSTVIFLYFFKQTKISENVVLNVLLNWVKFVVDIRAALILFGGKLHHVRLTCATSDASQKLLFMSTY